MAAELRVLETRARMLQQEILNTEELQAAVVPHDNSSQEGVDELIPRSVSRSASASRTTTRRRRRRTRTR
eukprot:3409967-Heterocapsa_arctica.AAC.1